MEIKNLVKIYLQNRLNPNVVQESINKRSSLHTVNVERLSSTSEQAELRTLDEGAIFISESMDFHYDGRGSKGKDAKSAGSVGITEGCRMAIFRDGKRLSKNRLLQEPEKDSKKKPGKIKKISYHPSIHEYALEPIEYSIKLRFFSLHTGAFSSTNKKNKKTFFYRVSVRLTIKICFSFIVR